MTSALSGRCGAVAIALLLLLTTLALVAGRPDTAAAGGPGQWTEISGSVGSLLIQPAAARGAGGDLLVTWITEGAKQDLKFRRITAAGAVSEMSTIVSGYGALNNPAIVYERTLDDSVYLFAGGVTSDCGGLHYWHSGDSGKSFTYRWDVSGPGGTAQQSRPMPS
jgi:hypothetical protein